MGVYNYLACKKSKDQATCAKEQIGNIRKLIDDNVRIHSFSNQNYLHPKIIFISKFKKICRRCNVWKEKNVKRFSFKNEILFNIK